MKTIKEINFYTRFPLNNYHYFKDLEDKETYLKEWALYNSLLLKFLLKNTSLKRIDEGVKDSIEFKLLPKKTNIDIYQYLCNDELDFFYIRSNIFPEHLNESERQFLDSLLNQDVVFDDKVERFIKDTYKKVIYENSRDNTRVCMNFGPSSTEDFYAPNDSLVIGGRIETSREDVQTTEDLFRYFDKINFFEQKCDYLEKALNDELNIDVKVIYYDDNSIKELI